MTGFQTARLPAAADAMAPDGCEVRLLARVGGGSMAHFTLPDGAVSTAVVHRTVDEIWYFLSGRGELWRGDADREEVVPVQSGVCVTIAQGTRFQVRALGDGPLVAVAVTLPPWPGEDEARVVDGRWLPTVGQGVD